MPKGNLVRYCLFYCFIKLDAIELSFLSFTKFSPLVYPSVLFEHIGFSLCPLHVLNEAFKCMRKIHLFVINLTQTNNLRVAALNDFLLIDIC